jgi:multisubunit Na+/H+ antiporter MnhB subunit
MEYRREDESEAVYCYWGYRLLELYEELKEPRPRGIFHWVQERTEKRHFMMLTIVGVLFAVLSLAVSVFSALVSYQQ